jgi:DNA-binding GntR family transcriptional regulator
MKPIERGSATLADSAYRRISDALLTKAIRPGTRLVMDQLADQLDISRTPVRDALLRLEREGMIEPSGRRGYVVREVQTADQIHLDQAREAIECLAAREAARIGADAIDYISKVVEASANVDARDAHAVYHASMQVHRAFVEVLDNPMMLDLFDYIWKGARLYAMFADYLACDPTRGDVATSHRPLVSALREGPDAASSAMDAHIKGHLDD